MRSARAWIALAVLGLLLIAVASSITPDVETENDPAIRAAVLAEIHDVLTPEALVENVTGALDEGRVANAVHYLRAAELIELPVPEDLEERYQSQNGWVNRTFRGTKDCADGFILGNGERAASFACSIASDLTLVGDVRDVAIETGKAATGDGANKLVLGLALAGIALEATTVASAGSAVPAKIGTSLLKAGVKSAVVSERLIDQASTIVKRSIKLSVADDIRKADGAGSSSFKHRLLESISFEKLEPITSAGKQLYEIRQLSSLEGTIKILKHADSLEDIAAGKTIARQFGSDTATVLEVIGKRAFRIAESAFLFSWHLLLWIISTVVTVVSFSVLIWRSVKTLYGFTRRRSDPQPGYDQEFPIQ